MVVKSWQKHMHFQGHYRQLFLIVDGNNAIFGQYVSVRLYFFTTSKMPRYERASTHLSPLCQIVYSDGSYKQNGWEKSIRLL